MQFPQQADRAHAVWRSEQVRFLDPRLAQQGVGASHFVGIEALRPILQHLVRIAQTADLVPCGNDGTSGGGIFLHLLARQEEGRFHAVGGKDWKDRVLRRRARAVVERQRDDIAGGRNPTARVEDRVEATQLRQVDESGQDAGNDADQQADAQQNAFQPIGIQETPPM